MSGREIHLLTTHLLTSNRTKRILSAVADTLPISETIEPADQQELVEAVRACAQSQTAIYPIGGGTSLDFGLVAKEPGYALSLAKLHRVVDFPARDMTVTVEAGVTMRALAESLAAEKLQLPVDVPQADKATLGGVVATNFNGPRRYGYGSLRDFVIGTHAVDGRGTQFKGGGRVVKNVAGYDFCKLLTGSLGTLGVITQLTLKLKPIAERSVLMACTPADLDSAESMLAELAQSETMPAAVELLTGPAWENDPALPGAADMLRLVVGLEGTAAEVDWMVGQLDGEWRLQDAHEIHTFTDQQAADLWSRLAEFPAGEAPLVVKASVAPSGVTPFIAAAKSVDPECSIQAHAGNGIVLVRFSDFPAAGLAQTVVGKLAATAAAHHGSVVVLSNPSGAEMTHQAAWGGIDAPFDLMTAVKRQFDPHNLLNPGRFVYL